jgi:hypothetical protein
VLTPAQIRQAALPGVGPFGRAYVRQLLAEVANRVAELEAELAWAWYTVRLREEEIEQRRYGVGLPARTDPVHDEQILRWQIEAQRLSDELTAAAQAQASEIVDAAQRQADLLRGHPGVDHEVRRP